MRRTLSFVAVTALVIALSPIADASGQARFSPGAPGVGDPYFPLDGNGGYDVQHYGLNLTYDPATDRLIGVATIEATPTKNLSRFNFDFDGLTVRSIRIDGRRATWDRDAWRAHDHAPERTQQGSAVRHRCPLRRHPETDRRIPLACRAPSGPMTAR